MAERTSAWLRNLIFGGAVVAGIGLFDSQIINRYKNDPDNIQPPSNSESTACNDAATAGTAKYLLASASGANNGTSWTDAWTSMVTAEANLTRGQTLCVGDGAYQETTFDVASSGTTPI